MSTPRNEKSESDVGSDSSVASSRAGKDDDGSYVGRTGSDDALDGGESGAEARSNDGSAPLSLALSAPGRRFTPYGVARWPRR